MQIPFFRIFYSTTYTALFILLLSLIVLTPVDVVYQAYRTRQFLNIFIVAGVYVLTALLAILIYASRLYTNRSVLAAIPKAWIPVDDGDVGKSVRRLIVEGLARSALIVYEARPRYIDEEEVEDPRPLHHSSPLPPRPTSETWAHISHPGWSSPSSVDLPNLHYDSVISELPNLIEAKAVSLAPPDPYQTPEPQAATAHLPAPDPRIVEVLQRPSTMGLRDYMAYLSTLSLIDPPTLAADFLALYERARFSGGPLPEKSFRAMMQIFAEILRGMKELNPDLIAELQHSESENENEDEEEEDSYTSFSSEEEGETSTPGGEDDGSVRRMKPPSRSPEGSLHSTASSPSLYTAPPPKSIGGYRTPSANSQAHSQGRSWRTPRTGSDRSVLQRHHPRLPSLPSHRDHSSHSHRNPSQHSLHPIHSRSQNSLQRLASAQSVASRASSRSVIRLADRAGEELDLPYVIETERY